MDGKIGVEITSSGDIAVAAFMATSISDVDGIAAVRAQIKQYIEKNRPKKVIFDFQQVKFFSSQVLGLLLDMRARVQAYEGQVVISAINPQLHRVFRITNLDKVFSFFPDTESAVKNIQSKTS